MKILFLLGLTALTFSCRKEASRWLTDNELPLVRDTLSLNDLALDSFLVSNSSGYQSIVIEQDLFNLNLDNLVGLPDTTIQKDFSLNFTFSAPAGFTLVNEVQENKLLIEPILLKQVRIKSGNLRVELSNPYSSKVIFTIVFPDVIIDGSVLTRTVSVDAGSISNPTILQKSIDLSRASLLLTGTSGAESNVLRSQITVQLDPNGGSVVSTPQHVMSVRSSLENIILSYAKGYFGSQTEETESVQDIAFFQDIQSGTFDLTSANVDLVITNFAKLAGRVKIIEIIGQTPNSQTVSLISPEVGIWRNLNSATGAYGSYQSQNLLYNFNFSNSNLEDLMEAQIDEIKIKYAYQINPNGNLSGSADEVFSNEILKLSLKANLPLSIGLTDLTLKDTLAVNFDKLVKNLDQLKQFSLEVSGSNYYLVSANMSLRFYNSDGVLESITPKNIDIASAIFGQLDVNNKKNKTYQTTIHFSEEEIRLLKNVKSIVVSAVLNTPNVSNLSVPVTFQDHQKLILKIVAQGQYEVLVN